MIRLKQILLALVLLTSVAAWAETKPVITSPNGKLTMELCITSGTSIEGELSYTVAYDGKSVLQPSRLGLAGWNDKMEIERVEPLKEVRTEWKPVYGERSLVKDHYNEQAVVVKRKGRGDRLHIIVRAYDEGIAFRYKMMGGGYFRMGEEFTTFATPEETYCWFAPYAQSVYQKLPIKNWPGESERPLTLQLANGLYASLTEAAVVDYVRTKFMVSKDEENIIRCKMYEPIEDIAPYATPWRVVMVAERPGDLLANNDIILNLNDPCQIADPSWIKPGKIFRIVDLTTKGAKQVIDFAVKRNIEYVHFDAGWYGAETSKDSDPRKSDVDPARCKVNDLNMPEVVAYAKEKGLKVWLYVNQRALTQYLDEILPLYQSWGIAGIKFGFVHVGSYRWTTWLHDAIKKCADHRLMVDIHDEYRPTGFSRTYPNLLTQEGVRGNEEFPDGVINTTLPFTRFIAGASDCTFCYFHRKELKPDLANRMNTRSLENTSCHQMALSIINYSPLQYIYWYDTPVDVTEEPEIGFWDNLPTVWDDTKVIDGEIAGFITIARRKADAWYVAAITNNDARKKEIALSFLDPAKRYEMTFYTDGGEKVKTRTHVAIATKKVDAKTIIKTDLLARGGCVMVIKELAKR